MLRVYNTLTRKKEDFQTLEPDVVKMYVCGVTVYSDAHVGHAMSALVFDIIRRYLEYRGFEVRHVMNYTDVDDKIIARANQLKEEPLKLAQRYIEDYARDLRDLNVLPASSNPRATRTMTEIQDMVKGLIDKGYAYAASNGDVYFRVTKDPQYGKLSGRKLDDMQAGARNEPGEAKEHPMDFALWKASKPGEPAWDSPWGKGRPGWHIECSAMNLAELGEQIDIHGGGNDLIFPHHENEIAQSEFVHRQGVRPLLDPQRDAATRRRKDVQVAWQHHQHPGIPEQARCRCDAHAGAERIIPRPVDVQRRDARRGREKREPADVRVKVRASDCKRSLGGGGLGVRRPG